MNINKNKIR
jgi:hypothetical protein